MKLYRVVPNIFSYKNRLNAKKIPDVEAMYYKMGYASFSGEPSMHKYNNVVAQHEKIPEGKYFFPFLEDAIKQGYSLLTLSHKLQDVEAFYIIEYDFPEEIIIKHFGFGDYKDDLGIPNYLMEIYVEKKDFITSENASLDPQQIASKKKIEILLAMLNETLSSAMAQKNGDYLWYYDYCERNYMTLSEFMDSPRLMQEAIEYFPLYFPQKGELIKTNYRTGNMIMVNIPNLVDKGIVTSYRDWPKASELFESFGRCDFSQHQQEFKSELIELAGNNKTGTKDPEGVLKLLRSANYL